MELPRGSIKELTDPRNRDVVAVNTPKLWAAYRRSMNRAAYFLSIPHPTAKDKEGRPLPLYPRQQAKVDALNEAMFQTASMGGKGQDSIRDAAIGAKAPTLAVAAQQPRAPDGTPML